MSEGLFISFEGGDGSGKGTQSKLLFNFLEGQGVKTKFLSFPQYHTATGRLVKNYLNGEFGDNVHPELAGSLYTFDRLAAKPEIEDWLAQGGVIISDRFSDSNKGHMGGKFATNEERIAYFDDQDAFEHQALGIPKPDKTILFPMPAELAQSYVDQKMARTYTDKKRDLHEADPEHLKQANLAYRLLAAHEPDRFIVIDPVIESQKAMREIDSIHSDVVNALQPLLETRLGIHRPYQLY